jgi:hypothetical protein
MFKKSSATSLAVAPATITANPGAQYTDRATWSEQADKLAGKHARAEAVQWGSIAGSVVLVVAVLVYLLSDVDFFSLALGVAGVLLAVAVALVMRVSWVYSHELRRLTRATERATWAKEEALDEDLTGDGYVGDPFNRVQVNRGGQTVDEVIVPHPSHSAKHEPKLVGWGVSASDLVAFVFEAERGRGLIERAWVGEGVARFSLPSGAVVTQPLFRQVLAALADHELDGQPMAAKEAQRWILKAKAEAIALEMQP